MTFQNKPLRITSPASCPNLGLSICPGKVDPWAYSGPCRRNLVEDLKAIKEWGAKLIITLMENDELEYLHVANLGVEAKKFGLLWRQWEVIDGSALRVRNVRNIDP